MREVERERESESRLASYPRQSCNIKFFNVPQTWQGVGTWLMLVNIIVLILYKKRHVFCFLLYIDREVSCLPIFFLVIAADHLARPSDSELSSKL